MTHISEVLKKYFDEKITELKTMQDKIVCSNQVNGVEEAQEIAVAIAKMQEISDLVSKGKQ